MDQVCDFKLYITAARYNKKESNLSRLNVTAFIVQDKTIDFTVTLFFERVSNK